MGVSLYYNAGRATALSAAETVAVERVVTDHAATFPYPDGESLHLYDTAHLEPGELLSGSTKTSLDPDRVVPVLTLVLDAVTRLRRALPDADWRVHLDDFDIPWTDVDGYVLPD